MANKRQGRYTNTPPAMASSPSVDQEEGVCDVCCHETKNWALGKCDHPTCLPCTTKLRLLCEQKECPVCRLSLKKVLMVSRVKPFSSFTNVYHWRSDRKYGVFFQNQSVELAYDALLANKCTLCPEPPFRTFRHLRDHTRRVHGLFYCDICTENLKLFPSEFKAYTREGLVVHRREGDKDDSSHKGHPLCQFCDERFLDNDHLHSHLRKNHFWCHFCESDGRQDYFADYPPLRQHFRTGHFLCEEGQCRHEKFTSVFRSKLDLQAHRASAHTKGLSKAEVKQLKQLDVGFSYGRVREDEELPPFRRARPAGRGGGDHSSRGGRSTNQERSREVVKSKPADPPKNIPPQTTSPVEEAKAPPGFEKRAQPPNTINGLTSIPTFSSGIVHNAFDPYGAMSTTLETVNSTPNVPSKPLNSKVPVAVTNPPPGFTSKSVGNKPPQQENEWPDLTETHTADSTLYPLGAQAQPVMGNITSAVMNATRLPPTTSTFVTSVGGNSSSISSMNLQSESSFPSLGATPLSASPPHVQSKALFPSVDHQHVSTSEPVARRTLLDPPCDQQSKLLKLAVAATTVDNGSSGRSGPSTYQVAVQSGRSIDLSSQNFPPMTTSTSDTTSGGGVPESSNQNDRVASGKRSPTSETKSKQSQVIEKVRKALSYNKEQFTHFKTLMGWYKNGEITVQEFKAQCVMLFGSKWREIGPEVAQVMPNHEKKNELLSSFGIRSGAGKSTKSQRKTPVSTPSVWGSAPAVPVRNFNKMSTGFSSDDYPSLSSAVNQPKVLPQPTPWNVVIQ